MKGTHVLYQHCLNAGDFLEQTKALNVRKLNLNTLAWTETTLKFIYFIGSELMIVTTSKIAFFILILNKRRFSICWFQIFFRHNHSNAALSFCLKHFPFLSPKTVKERVLLTIILIYIIIIILFLPNKKSALLSRLCKIKT